MSATVEQIKDKLSISDVVGSYIKIERAGKNFKARCPFHNEKTPSFFVSPDRNAYHCFGCNRGGDIFSFVQEFEGLDFIGALRVLADRAGVEITPIDPEAQSERERLFGLLEKATKFFEEQLEKNKVAQKYLIDRGLTEEAIDQFRIGYAPDAWRDLHEHFSEAGYTDEELSKVGLIKESEKGKKYDTFRARVMFPIVDGAGRVIAFSGRILSKGDKEAPKYLNSPETLLFNKSSVLYGLHRAKQSIHKYGFAIVVEGQMDVLLAHMEGYSNTVAPLGTALTASHLTRLHQLTDNVVFAFDADSAGLASFQKASRSALHIGFDVKVALLPKGKDPADVITKNSEDWKKIVKEARHTVDFLLEVLREEYTDERKFKKEVSKTVLPFLNSISNKIDQAHFIKSVAEVLRVSENAVYQELEKLPADEEMKVESAPTQIARSPHSRRDMALERIMGVLEWQKHVSDSDVDVLAIEKRLTTLIGEKDLNGWSKASRESDERAFEAEVALGDTLSLDKYLEELFLILEGELLQEELSISLSELRDAEKKEDTKLVENLMIRCQDLTQKIQERKDALLQLQ